MFVIQRVLEVDGKLTLLDQNRVIRPHPPSACSRRPTPWASAIPPASTTAPSRSTRARWTAGTSSPPSTTCRTTPRSTSCSPRSRPTRPPRAARRSRPWSRSPISPAGLHQRRHLDRHVAAHGDHLGRERADLRRHRLRLPGHLPEQVRRDGAPDRWPSTTSAASAPSCRKAASRPPNVQSRDASRWAVKPEVRKPPRDLQARDTAATMRAIAARDELEVSLRPRARGLVGTDRASAPAVPRPARRRTRKCWCAAIADACALRLRHHDAGLHAARAARRTSRRGRSSTRSSRRAAKRSASRRMAGRRRQPGCALEQRCPGSAATWHSPPRGRSAAGRGRALLAREAMTGEAPPPSAPAHGRPVAPGSWNPRCRRDLERLRNDLTDQDQAAFAASLRRPARDLDWTITEPRRRARRRGERAEEGEERQRPARPAARAASDDSAERTSRIRRRAAATPRRGRQPSSGCRRGRWRCLMPGRRRTPGPARPSAALRRRRPTTVDHDATAPSPPSFDEVVEATDLCDPEELTRLRQMLDQQLAHLHGVIAPSWPTACSAACWPSRPVPGTSISKRACSTPARLSRVVVDPMHPLSFKQERDTEFRDTVVSLLIDNSGSMRGRPITVAAMSADILARTLERCGVKVEILGFTTRMWKGGQSRERWLAAGKPANRAPQRPAPHRLQVGRRALAARAQEPRSDAARRHPQGEHRRRGAVVGPRAPVGARSSGAS